MREMFRRFRYYLIILALPWLFFMFMLTYRINYQITTPGNLTNISSYIEVADEYEQENPIYSVYVMSFRNPTFFQFLIATLNDHHHVRQLTEREVADGIGDSEQFESGQVDRNTSIDASFITSLEALGLPIEYEIEYIVRLYYHYIDIKADQTLHIGDIILSVNGNDDVMAALGEASCDAYHSFLIERREGTTETLEIKRQIRNSTCVFGLNVTEFYRITDAAVELITYDSLIGGPSGGLMQTLYIYNALSDVDLTSGIKIAGTGGINLDGSAISVGGIREKVITAERKGVDVFFVPRNENITNDNYTIATRTKADIGAELTIIGVETFADVIDYLLRVQAGDIDE